MSYICEKCGKTVEDSEKFGSGRFCSRSCANGHKHSEETKQKIASLQYIQEELAKGAK